VADKPQKDSSGGGLGGRGLKWKSETKCVVCGVIEYVDHILFKCPLAKMTWAGLREALGWDRQPGNLEDQWGVATMSLNFFLLQ
jgi:hypothetical protein